MIAPFLMVTTSSITMQRLGDTELCMAAVGVKMSFFCLSRSNFDRPFARVRYILNSYFVYGSILMLFSPFFSVVIALSGVIESLDSSYFSSYFRP